jgi:hypothetical protein
MKESLCDFTGHLRVTDDKVPAMKKGSRAAEKEGRKQKRLYNSRSSQKLKLAQKM